MPSAPSAMNADLVSAGRTLWQRLEEGLAPAAVRSEGLFAPDFCDLREELRLAASEPLEEVTQHLRDLGYLHGAPWNGRVLEDHPQPLLGPADELPLAGALLRFYADQDRFNEFFAYHLSPGESGEPVNVFRDRTLAARLRQPLVVTYATISRLRALTSLDGKLMLRGEPEPGETSLRTRVIHHLLLVYGVLPPGTAPGIPYGPATQRALRGVGEFRCLNQRDASLLAIINGLADFDAVAAELAYEFESVDLLVPGPDAGGDWNASFRSQLEGIRRCERAAGAAREASGTIWETADRNVCGARFLQVYLWYRGHYLGEIDGLWGPQSQAAFVDAAKAHAKPKARGAERAFWSIEQERGGDVLRLRVAEFIRYCEQSVRGAMRGQPEPESPDDLFQLQDAISAGLDELTDQGTSREERETQEAEVWSRVFRHVETAGEVQRERGGKLNYGMRMVGRGVSRLVRRLREIALGIKARVLSFLEKVAAFTASLLETISGAVLQAFRFLKRGMAAVMKTAAQAGRRLLRLATGAPFVSRINSRRWVATHFSFDQDAVTLTGLETSDSDLGGHFTWIAEENRALDISLRLGAKVLRIVAAVTPPLGAFAALRLALDVFRAVWNFFRDLQQTHGAGSPAWRTGMLMTT